MPDYKVNFKELKSRVGVTDVAYALGYRLDRKAGVGRYIEMVLGDGREKRDTLIVSHPNDRASQTFFRRNGSKGDVLTLIRENLDAFLVTGKDDATLENAHKKPGPKPGFDIREQTNRKD